MIDPNQERAFLLRRVLLESEDGRKVFALLQEELGTWEPEPPATLEQATLRAFGVRLLALMGITHLENMDLLYESLRGIPYRSAITDHEEDPSGS